MHKIKKHGPAPQLLALIPVELISLIDKELETKKREQNDLISSCSLEVLLKGELSKQFVEGLEKLASINRDLAIENDLAIAKNNYKPSGSSPRKKRNGLRP